MDKVHRQHLARSEDLVTSYEQTRAGFVAQALEKGRKATPLVAEARALKSAASKAATPADLTKFADIQPALLTAAGVSDKAEGHMDSAAKAEAIQGLIEKFLEPAGESFVEELVFRFLLTRGDTLGGSMRNWGGELAQRKLTRAVISALRLSKISYLWLPNKGKEWLRMSGKDVDIELHLKGLSWSIGSRDRTMMYNLKVPLIDKNVDMCLFNCDPDEFKNFAIKTPSHYIALGELKGGIDPAGADEHWKTASKALSRIRDSFSRVRLSPHTFFVGAAIANEMAKEIWGELEGRTLSNAANLTNEDQVASLCHWLVNL